MGEIFYFVFKYGKRDDLLSKINKMETDFYNFLKLRNTNVISIFPSCIRIYDGK